MARRSTRYPACIISTRLRWYTIPSKTCWRDWPSPRAGVAVTPTTSGPSGCQARQWVRMRRYEGAGAWCASSMTMVRKSGTRRASRARRLRVCTLATTIGAVRSSRAACTTPRGSDGSTRCNLSRACWINSSRCARIERPAAAALHEQGEDDRFARAGGQDQQGALHPARGRGQQGGHGFMLVGARGQAQQRGGSNGRHRGVPRRPGAWGRGTPSPATPEGASAKYTLCRHGTATAWPLVHGSGTEHRPLRAAQAPGSDAPRVRRAPVRVLGAPQWVIDLAGLSRAPTRVLGAPHLAWSAPALTLRGSPRGPVERTASDTPAHGRAGARGRGAANTSD